MILRGKFELTKQRKTGKYRREWKKLGLQSFGSTLSRAMFCPSGRRSTAQVVLFDFSGPFGKFHQVYLVDINLKRKEDSWNYAVQHMNWNINQLFTTLVFKEKNMLLDCAVLRPTRFVSEPGAFTHITPTRFKKSLAHQHWFQNQRRNPESSDKSSSYYCGLAFFW